MDFIVIYFLKSFLTMINLRLFYQGVFVFIFSLIIKIITTNFLFILKIFSLPLCQQED